MRFFNSETDIQVATIASLVDERELSLLWRPDPLLPEATLLTTYELTRDALGTTVTLTHTGYESVPAEQRASWLVADRGAVPAIADALRTYLSEAT